jgi:hypothetical protein
MLVFCSILVDTSNPGGPPPSAHDAHLERVASFFLIGDETKLVRFKVPIASLGGSVQVKWSPKADSTMKIKVCGKSCVRTQLVVVPPDHVWSIEPIEPNGAIVVEIFACKAPACPDTLQDLLSDWPLGIAA